MGAGRIDEHFYALALPDMMFCVPTLDVLLANPASPTSSSTSGYRSCRAEILDITHAGHAETNTLYGA